MDSFFRALYATLLRVCGCHSETNLLLNDSAAVDAVVMRSAIKWHVQLQRARRRTFITPVNAPDELSSFAGAVAAGHASCDSRFHRQSSAMAKSPGAPPMRKEKSGKSFSSRLTEEEHDEEDETGQQQQQHQKRAKAEEQEAAQTGKSHRMGSLMVRSHEIDENDAEVLPLASATVGTFSCHGMDDFKDKINQDCACVAFPCHADEEAALFIVLDGHGKQGDIVSNELLQQLYERLDGSRAGEGITNYWGGDDAEMKANLVQGFEEAHETLLAFNPNGAEQIPGRESGAAGVALVLRKGRVIMGHSGDCRAVMGALDAKGNYVAVSLTEDHKLESPGEKARIEATGVIPTPEVAFRTLEAGKDKFIVLASDGVWEFLSNELVVEMVGGFLKRGEPASEAARFLIAKAASAWRAEEGDYRDDITAIVIYLDSVPSGLGTR